MKFGIREVCDCYFQSLDGKTNFSIDTAKMSTLESSSTTVYAQGGRGYSRLAAWEGEKSVTFTVEDAILSTESIQALLGEKFESGRIRVKANSFAGYYKVTAQTLVRNIDNGNDIPARITIHKAKLQSSLNLSMSPTGEPSAFTFTFDAFATDIDDDKGVLYDFALVTTGEATDDLAEANTILVINTKDNRYEVSTNAETPTVTIKGLTSNNNDKGAVTINGTLAVKDKDFNTVSNFALNLAAADSLINAYSFMAYKPKNTSESVVITLEKGSYTEWYIV